MTLRELYEQVLQQLEVTAAGEPSAPEDVAVVRDRYPKVYDMLLTKGLVSWGVTADIPEYAALPLVDILAYVCAKPFGKDETKYAVQGALDLPAGQSIAELQLRRQLAPAYITTTQRTEYF